MVGTAQPGSLQPAQRIDLSVERVGNRLVVQLDPQAIRAAGNCCNCNSAVDIGALGALTERAAATTAGSETR